MGLIVRPMFWMAVQRPYAVPTNLAGTVYGMQPQSAAAYTEYPIPRRHSGPRHIAWFTGSPLCAEVTVGMKIVQMQAARIKTEDAMIKSARLPCLSMMIPRMGLATPDIM